MYHIFLFFFIYLALFQDLLPSTSTDDPGTQVGEYIFWLSDA